MRSQRSRALTVVWYLFSDQFSWNASNISKTAPLLERVQRNSNTIQPPNWLWNDTSFPKKRKVIVSLVTILSQAGSSWFKSKKGRTQTANTVRSVCTRICKTRFYSLLYFSLHLRKSDLRHPREVLQGERVTRFGRFCHQILYKSHQIWLQNH